MTKQRTTQSLAVGVLALAAFTGCSSREPAPRELLGAAKMAVFQAERKDNAAQLAPADLQRAQEKLTAADRAIERNENVKARRLSEQAIVDAQLAQARTRAMESGYGASEARDALQDVQRTDQQIR